MVISFGARFTHGFRFGGDIHHVRFASGVDMGQLRHTYFFKCGWKLHWTRTGIQLWRNDIFPCGTARFGRTRHGENQRFVSDARYRTRLQRGSANLFERQHPEHFTKTFSFTVEQRQQRFGA